MPRFTAVNKIVLLVVIALTAWLICTSIATPPCQPPGSETGQNTHQDAGSMTKGPWVIDIDDNQATLAWEATGRIDFSVEVAGPDGTTTTYSPKTYTAEQIETMSGLSEMFEPDGTQYRATIPVPAGTAVSYRIVSKTATPAGESQTGTKVQIEATNKTQSFLLHGEPDADQPLNIVVYGDSRTYHERHRRIATQIAGLFPQAVLHTADLVGYGYRSDDWQDFFDAIAAFAPATLLIPSFGNHERLGQAAYASYFFKLPPEDAPFGCAVKHFGPLWVLVLNSELGFEAGGEQQRWMQTQLQGVKDDTSAPFRVAMFHRPMLTWAHHEPDELGDEATREAMHAAFLKAGVQAVFAGHNHCYERFERDGIQYLTLGGGAARLADPERKVVEAQRPWRRASAKEFHFLHALQNGDTLDVFIRHGFERERVLDRFSLHAAQQEGTP